MTRSTVLLVAPTPHIAKSFLAHLADAEVHVTVATSFAAARDRLSTHHPDLVISEIRLGAYNGLHLAVRAHEENIPVIVIGSEDVVLRRDAEKFGATYVSADCDRRQVRALMRDAGVLSSASGQNERGRGTHAA